MTTNNVEVEANVYSVVSIRTAEVAAVTKAYLYDHTSVEVGFDLRDVTAVVLKTSSAKSLAVDSEDIYDSGLAPEVRGLVRNASQLAQNQVDRFSSGLYAGRVCGSLQDANEYVLQLAG